jgi:predicted CopG family antitoxin
VYERLNARKREDERFTELVGRLAENTDPVAFVRSYPDLDTRDDAIAPREAASR